MISAGTSEFAGSGLKVSSVVRLGFLAVLPESHFVGKLGSVSGATVIMLLRRLSDYLVKPEKPNKAPEPTP